MPIHTTAITRFKTEKTSGGYRITIPAYGGPLAIAFHLVWVGVLAVATIQLVPQASRGSGGTFLLIWLLMCIPPALVCLFFLSWQLFGREVLTVRQNVLEYRWEVGPIGRTRTFDRHSVESIRGEWPKVQSPGYRHEWLPPIFRLEVGGLAFDYQGREVRIGRALDESQGRALAEVLRGVIG